MPNADSMILAAGGVALAGNFKIEGGFPTTGYTIVGATVALTFLASTVKGSALESPVKAAAGLMLLVALIRYIPGLATTPLATTKTKR